MSELPITRQWLDKMQGKDAFVQRLFTVFITEEPKRMDKIRSALKEQDTTQLAHLTHSLKGGAATMGAEGVRQCSLDLELAAKDQDTQRAAACLATLEDEMERVYAFMREKLKEMDAHS